MSLAMSELQGEGTIRETKKRRKSFLSVLLQYRAALSKSKSLLDMFQSKRRQGGTKSTVKQAVISPITYRDQAVNSPTTYRDASMRVPIEILTEIASHLLPVDVISLSHCNKFFRNMLMNRSSRHIWTSAINNVEDLPPCPPDMSEPYYVKLLFLPWCTICGENEDCESYLELRLRLCVLCRSIYLMNVSQHLQERDELWFPRELDGLVHRVEIYSLGMSLGFNVIKEEVGDIRSRLEELHKSGDEAALNTWKGERMAAVKERARQVYAIHCFFTHWDYSQRLNNLQDVSFPTS
ncbi:hypothetical protein RSOL_213100 [Rhizoctonia solani AG-3 Rhs1AP]|uniref:F-box domain-containing protein n=2 Tax=Rhizoctonia solani AG-3 TaxID=1086053 RepID=A0A074SG98_9AGAM|nr:hypothetical protein RSOL_213100 [Rhizoctonia solani AG-3 Rhs1AP]KEP49082.1 hypothetical protein V565_108540 [Rhizoctonia solani 123E]